MSSPAQIYRVSSFKTPEAFRAHLRKLHVAIPCDDQIVRGASSPLAQALESVRVNGKLILNRYAIQPMEGWDGTTTGGATDRVIRRWRRFGFSGAKLICGGEAMAVRADGRANPNQLVINDQNQGDLAKLVGVLLEAHRERFGINSDPVIGFQLTHSGRFCKPVDHHRLEPRVAYRHPLLDARFGVSSDSQVFTDGEIERLIQDYIRAARIAWNAGADFVDLKHCHGYLLHEFLSAFRRPGKYGGPFENRTRILREIVAGIRADNNPIDVGVRLSAFDTVPFRPDPAQSAPGRPGPGIPEDFSRNLPYEYGFGLNPRNPLEVDLTEPLKFLELCVELGVKIVNLSGGSPYYNPHIQRPAAYPPSDGYLPPEDPLAGVARQMGVARQLRSQSDQRLILVGSAYSYLQEFLPHVAQGAVRTGWVDIVGIGRMVLSYPEIFTDALTSGALDTKHICRTFSDCTTAPRNGLSSGCYPLDEQYARSAEAAQLKQLKRGARAGTTALAAEATSSTAGTQAKSGPS
jgi:2,4-dienoyl-CoA reductase-like NADH-dependent reductase (Old Yellow Enzyme family)